MLVNKLFSRSFLALTITYCLGCFFFGVYFYKFHFMFNGIPLFLSEFFLFILLALAISKTYIQKTFHKHKFAISYCLLLLIAIVVGLVKYGPLTLRHAALFYYPFYAYIAIILLDFEDLKKIWIMPFILVLMSSFTGVYRYYLFSLLMFTFLSTIFLYRNKKNKLYYAVPLLAVIFFPWLDLVKIARTFMVANFCAAMFIFVSLFALSKVKLINKFISSLLVLLVLLSVFIFKADKNALKSLTKFNELARVFVKYDRISKEKTVFNSLYKANLPVSLFGVIEKEEELTIDKASAVITPVEELTIDKASVVIAPVEELNIDKASVVIAPVEVDKSLALEPKVLEKDTDIDNKKDITKENKNEVKPEKTRNLTTSIINVVFRLFVWRDMFVEMFEKKAVFGFGLGKPYRSETIEALNWAATEWKTDGWISLHNSFFHAIYHFGILGLFLVMFVIRRTYSYACLFIRSNCVPGIACSSILINWIIALNFQPLLEVPYNAILFWTVFGITEILYRGVNYRVKN